jgi:hypothetical protein
MYDSILPVTRCLDEMVANISDFASGGRRSRVD